MNHRMAALPLLFLDMIIISAAIATLPLPPFSSPPYQTLAIFNLSDFDPHGPPLTTLANASSPSPPPFFHAAIFHRDSILRQFNQSSSASALWAERLQRDAARVGTILSAVRRNTAVRNASVAAAAAGDASMGWAEESQERRRRHHDRRRRRRRQKKDVRSTPEVGGKGEEVGRGINNSSSRSRATPGFPPTAGGGAAIGGGVVSGASLGSGEYLTRIGVGTPATPALMVLDTGSDLTWLQCAPCGECYMQIGPLFSPAESATYRAVECMEPMCRDSAEIQGRCGVSGGCVYGVEYGDGSVSEGTLGRETLRFGGAPPAAPPLPASSAVENVILGCGRDNVGRFSIASGLLGLGAGRLSLPSQLRSDFAYCLPPSAARSGLLILAPNLTTSAAAAAAAAAATPILPSVTPFYTIRLLSVSVAGSLLPIRPLTLIVDSGTTISHLHPSLYAPLRRAFLLAAAANLAPVRLPPGAVPVFDTCFDLSAASQSVLVPSLDLHFADVGGGAASTVRLPAENYLVRVDEAMAVYCLAMAASDDGMSILGNIQQQGFLYSFSSRSGVLSVTPNYC